MKNQFVQKLFAAFSLGFVLTVLTPSVYSQNMFRKMNDFDGDGKTDFTVTRREGDSKVWYIWQSRDGFKAFLWGIYNDIEVPGDYDGDGTTDLAIWRPGSGQAYYWVLGSKNGISVFPWGLSTDTVVQP